MQDLSAHIQPYDLQRDEPAVLALWQQTVGHTWPIQAARLRQVLAGPEAQHFVVREDTGVIGFAATFKSMRAAQKVGHLAALFVAPHRQGQGIGTALHTAALKYLAGLSAVQLGGTSPRFWCGIPGNLPLAAAFFRARGWHYTETVYDIVQDLHTYTTPAYIQQRVLQEHIHFAPATSQNVTAVLTFEAREFPSWYNSYSQIATLKDYQDILMAYDETEQIIGSLLLYSPQSHSNRSDLIWQMLLSEDAGALGSVGVAASERGRGIGIALVAYGTELLKERGIGNCYIDWVELTEFYGKLGYKKWCDYQLSWRLS